MGHHSSPIAVRSERSTSWPRLRCLGGCVDRCETPYDGRARRLPSPTPRQPSLSPPSRHLHRTGMPDLRLPCPSSSTSRPTPSSVDPDRLDEEEELPPVSSLRLPVLPPRPSTPPDSLTTSRRISLVLNSNPPDPLPDPETSEDDGVSQLLHLVMVTSTPTFSDDLPLTYRVWSITLPLRLRRPHRIGPTSSTPP